MLGDHVAAVGGRDDIDHLKLFHHLTGVVCIHGGIQADAVAGLFQGEGASAHIIPVGEFLSDGCGGGLRVLGEVFYFEIVLGIGGVVPDGDEAFPVRFAAMDSFRICS